LPFIGETGRLRIVMPSPRLEVRAERVELCWTAEPAHDEE
jgi:hypothetical protein